MVNIDTTGWSIWVPNNWYIRWIFRIWDYLYHQRFPRSYKFCCSYVGWEAFPKLSPCTPKLNKSKSKVDWHPGTANFCYLHLNFMALIWWTKTGVAFRINQGCRVRYDTSWFPPCGLVERCVWPYSCGVWWEGDPVGGDWKERQGPGPVPDSVMTLSSYYLKHLDNTHPFWGLCYLLKDMRGWVGPSSISLSKTLLHTSHHLCPCSICKLMSHVIGENSHVSYLWRI